MGIKMILGLNGWIWIEPIEDDDFEAFEKISKIRNLLKIFEELYVSVRIKHFLEALKVVGSCKASEMLEDSVKEKVMDYLAEVVKEEFKENVSEVLFSKK
jgi:exosome complex RNA-binding protein Rrp4